MSGWFEVRIDGPKRHHYRLFCLLDYEAKGQEKPLIVVVDGRDKPFRTTPERYRLCGGALNGRGVPEPQPALGRLRSTQEPWNGFADRGGGEQDRPGRRCARPGEAR